MCTPYLSSWYQDSFQIAEVKCRLVYVAMLAVLRTMSVDHPSPKVSDLALAKGKPTTRMMTSGVLSFSSENCAAFGYINLSQNRHVKMRQPPGSHWWHCELLMVALFRLKKTSEMWTKEMLFRCRRLPGSWFPLKVKEYHDLRNKPTQSAYITYLWSMALRYRVRVKSEALKWCCSLFFGGRYKLEPLTFVSCNCSWKYTYPHPLRTLWLPHNPGLYTISYYHSYNEYAQPPRRYVYLYGFGLDRQLPTDTFT